MQLQRVQHVGPCSPMGHVQVSLIAISIASIGWKYGGLCEAPALGAPLACLFKI
jgi:hypothetical protein